MLRVGLTGGIATGKSYVVSVLRELGCEAIDADEVAHAMIAPGGPAYDEVVGEFGPEILGAGGVVDRGRLGAIVFADPERRARLEAIVHPQVIAAQERWLAEVAARRPDAVAVVEAALLIEAGAHRRVDKVVVVHCAPASQLERLMARGGLAREAALWRIESQLPAEEKLKYADYAIDTTGGFAETRRQVETIHAELDRLARGRV
jgi:dephospho-CoA kinase